RGRERAPPQVKVGEQQQRRERDQQPVASERRGLGAEQRPAEVVEGGREGEADREHGGGARRVGQPAQPAPGYREHQEIEDEQRLDQRTDADQLIPQARRVVALQDGGGEGERVGGEQDAQQ